MILKQIIKATLLLTTSIFILSCSTAEQNGNNSHNNLDIEEPSDIEEEEEITIVPWTPEPEEPPAECIECDWYFCPPLDEIWRKEICFNVCEDPKVLYSESECIQYMECDPTQYVIDELECTTEDGYPGTQQNVCNKGLLQYTDSITNCEEEK